MIISNTLLNNIPVEHRVYFEDLSLVVSNILSYNPLDYLISTIYLDQFRSIFNVANRINFNIADIKNVDDIISLFNLIFNTLKFGEYSEFRENFYTFSESQFKLLYVSFLFFKLYSELKTQTRSDTHYTLFLI